ncbi:MAG: DUF2207 domain-containing protein [Christensenellales bacterium]
MSEKRDISDNTKATNPTNGRKGFTKKRKLITKIVGIALILSLFISSCTTVNLQPANVSAGGLIQINSYDVNIVVNENNTYDVNENITAVLNNTHGLRRDIPLDIQRVHSIDGKAEVKPYHAFASAVKSDIQFSTTTDNGIYSIFLGDPDKTVSGVQNYNFSYTYDAGNDGYQQFDEFYYNIIDADWAVPIGDVTFSITMPKEFDSSKAGFYLGTQGASESKDVDYTVNGNVISGKITRSLLPEEGLLIYLELPNGYYSPKTPSGNTVQNSSGWIVETVDSEGDVGEYTSLAVDDFGYPHIAYFDSTNGVVKYATNDGSNWSIQTVGNARGSQFQLDAGINSIALDGSGKPYISYGQGEEGYFYTFLDGSSWAPPVRIPTNEPSATNLLGQNSMAIDKITGKIFVSMSDCESAPEHPYIGDILTYWDSAQSDFSVIGYGGEQDSTSFGNPAGERNVIALDSKGNPHIVYDQEDSSGRRTLIIADWDGKQWVKSTITPFTAVCSDEHRFQISLKFDSKDYPHIAYFNEQAYGYQYAYWNGSSWIMSTICEYGSVGWECISMDLDANDNPHVAVLTGGYKLMYAKLDGNKWATEIVDSENGYDCEIAVGQDGAVHIVYYDATNRDLKYARLNK